MQNTALKKPRNFDIPVEVRISSRAKRMALRLDSSARVMNLVVPRRANIDKAYKFAQEHEEWIRQKIAELPKPILFKNGAIIPVLGQNRRINVIYDKDLKSTRFTLNRYEIKVVTNQRDPSARIIRFLRQEARETLTGLSVKKAARIGKKISNVQVRDTKTRWGSCSTGGRLSFSWRLIFAPWEVIDYLVAHEVAHLVHMNHSKRFWTLCESLSDDYKGGKDWIADHGVELMRYGGYSDQK